MNQKQRRKEDRACAALITLALHDEEMLTDKELERYMNKPIKLSKADSAALKRVRPRLIESLGASVRRANAALSSVERKP